MANPPRCSWSRNRVGSSAGVLAAAVSHARTASPDSSSHGGGAEGRGGVKLIDIGARTCSMPPISHVESRFSALANSKASARLFTGPAGTPTACKQLITSARVRSASSDTIMRLGAPHDGRPARYCAESPVRRQIERAEHLAQPHKLAVSGRRDDQLSVARLKDLVRRHAWMCVACADRHLVSHKMRRGLVRKDR